MPQLLTFIGIIWISNHLLWCVSSLVFIWLQHLSHKRPVFPSGRTVLYITGVMYDQVTTRRVVHNEELTLCSSSQTPYGWVVCSHVDLSAIGFLARQTRQTGDLGLITLSQNPPSTVILATPPSDLHNLLWKSSSWNKPLQVIGTNTQLYW